MFMFSKKRSVVLTADKIYIFNKRDTQPRYIQDYSDILGLTLSLLVGAKNLILHFTTQADEEWQCEHRQDLIEVLAQKYQEKLKKSLDIYGVSSNYLSVYLTTERDLARKVSRMPDQNFKLEQRSSLYKSQVSQSQVQEDWDDYEELFDDFIILDKGELDRYNAPAKLNKAKSEKDSGPS